MPEPPTFLMGKFAAALPADLRYCRNHMWCRPGADGTHRFGFTAYALRLMQDVYFLEWKVNDGDEVDLLQEIGFIESSKAESALYAPAQGNGIRFNPELLSDPSRINVDTYGAAWLFELECPGDTLMSPGEYHQFLTDNWEKTQRLIKGKINTED